MQSWFHSAVQQFKCTREERATIFEFHFRYSNHFIKSVTRKTSSSSVNIILPTSYLSHSKTELSQYGCALSDRNNKKNNKLKIDICCGQSVNALLQDTFQFHSLHLETYKNVVGISLALRSLNEKVGTFVSGFSASSERKYKTSIRNDISFQCKCLSILLNVIRNKILNIKSNFLKLNAKWVTIKSLRDNNTYY